MGRALLPLLLAAPLLLAGCAEDVAPAAEATPPTTVVVTDPGDVASLRNQSLTMERHVHDYWGGEERLVVMDEKRPAQTFFVSPNWSVLFDPPAGRLVPQGTARVEITMTWTDSPGDTYSPPALWVRTAADHETALVGTLKKGEPLVVETTLAQADLPHQGLSAWRFEWRVHPGQVPGLVWFRGEVGIRVEAVRGLDIPAYPPHPDMWGGAEARPLFDDKDAFGVWRGDSRGGFECYGDCPRMHRPVDGALVPFDAALVEVTLTMGAESRTQLGLSYHAADTREWQRLQPARTEGQKRVYLIEVQEGMGDGPYASQSQWEFLPFIEGPVQDGWHAGSYVLQARALREAP